MAEDQDKSITIETASEILKRLKNIQKYWTEVEDEIVAEADEDMFVKDYVHAGIKIRMAAQCKIQRESLNSLIQEMEDIIREKLQENLHV